MYRARIIKFVFFNIAKYLRLKQKNNSKKLHIFRYVLEEVLFLENHIYAPSSHNRV